MNNKNSKKIILIILLFFSFIISVIASLLIIYNWNSFFNKENNIGEESMGIIFFQQGILLFFIDFTLILFLTFLYRKIRKKEKKE